MIGRTLSGVGTMFAVCALVQTGCTVNPSNGSSIGQQGDAFEFSLGFQPVANGLASVQVVAAAPGTDPTAHPFCAPNLAPGFCPELQILRTANVTLSPVPSAQELIVNGSSGTSQASLLQDGAGEDLVFLRVLNVQVPSQFWTTCAQAGVQCPAGQEVTARVRARLRLGVQEVQGGPLVDEAGNQIDPGEVTAANTAVSDDIDCVVNTTLQTSATAAFLNCQNADAGGLTRIFASTD